MGFWYIFLEIYLDDIIWGYLFLISYFEVEIVLGSKHMMLLLYSWSCWRAPSFKSDLPFYPLEKWEKNVNTSIPPHLLHLMVWWVSKKSIPILSHLPPDLCSLCFWVWLVILMGSWRHSSTLSPLFFFSSANFMTILSSSWDFPISLKFISKKKARTLFNFFAFYWYWWILWNVFVYLFVFCFFFSNS